MKKKIVFIALVFAVAFSAVGAYGQNASNPGANIGNFLNSIFGNSESSSTPASPEFEMNGTTLVKYNGSAANVTIPSNVTAIGEKAFSECDSIISVTIPSSVISIGNEAFGSCKNLTSINIPSSVKTIGNWAFSGSEKLTNITIPSSVTSIGVAVFGLCTSLTGITVDTRNTVYSSVEGVLFNKAKTNLINYPNGKEGNNYTIPSGVTSIEEWAFAFCNNLTGITIPSSVTFIGNYAFAFCHYITSITIPPTVTSIGEEILYYSNVKTITLSRNTSISDGAFSDDVRIIYSDSAPTAAQVQPAGPTNAESVNPNAIPLSAWTPSDGKSPGVTKRGFIGREFIEGQQRDVLAIEVTFPRETQVGGTSKWGAYEINDEFNLSKIRTATGVRFKALGDGKRWIFQLHTKETMVDYCSYFAEIKTVPNRVVEINIPYSSLTQPTWGKKAPFVKSNIMIVNLQRMTDNATEIGPSTLKIFDFEVYSGWEPAAPPPPTVNVNPNSIPPSAWSAGDGDSPGTTKRIFNTREAIAGQERDVLTLEATFPRQNSGKWATFIAGYNEQPFISRMRTGSGIRFKALGDGKRWIIQVILKVSGEDCGYEAEIKTTNNRMVDINIPYSSLKQANWGKKAPWNKNNIVGVNIQRNSSDSGNTSTLKIFDFEVY